MIKGPREDFRVSARTNSFVAFLILKKRINTACLSIGTFIQSLEKFKKGKQYKQALKRYLLSVGKGVNYCIIKSKGGIER